MIRFRPLPVLSVLSALALVILILLGNWQWKRFEMKRADLHTVVEKITIESFTPLPGKIQLVYGVVDGTAVWRVFVPVAHDGTATFLDVEALAGVSPPDWRTIPEPFTGPGGIQGAPVHPKPGGLFAPKPNAEKRTWYAADLAAMGRAAGLARVEPYYLAVPYIGPSGLAPNPFAHGHGLDPLPPERHMGYALTWWGLAAALLVVYAAFHIKAGRLAFGRRA